MTGWKTYTVRWSTIVYGTQNVRARNKEEASRKAMNSEDIDMSEGLDNADWSIDSIDEKKEIKMTTQFETKEDAISAGLFFAGRQDLCYDEKNGRKTLEDILKSPEIKVVDNNIEQFGYVHEDTLMIEFQNSKNRTCRIAATKFRDGFDIWLIDPESGFAHRA